MSLFGALASGVSGLTAQSSAMGAISDNITNISTIGYKNTRVDFQTLVTKQTSSTLFSAGGVQSKPRQDTGVQGLLQASSSSTDISISGGGYFVVNEAAVPTLSNQFLYSRAGSFFQDNSGFLRNTAGFYLQAWPTDASGNVIPANTAFTIANQNIVSTDYLSTVNLSRVGGTASATSQISIGANLPANAATGTSHRTDVQFFDSLGNAANLSFAYTRAQTENQWDISVDPPSGAAVLTLEDATLPTALTYASTGQLEFNIPDAVGTGIRRPADGSTVIIEGITYAFNTTGAPPADTATVKQVDVRTNTTIAQDVASLVAAVIASDSDFDTTNNRIAVSSNSSTTILFKDDGTRAITVDPTGLLDSTGTSVTTQTNAMTIKKPAIAYRDYAQFTFAGVPANGDTMTINGVVYTFDAAEVANDNDLNIRIDSVANMLADLEGAIETNDPNFAVGGTQIRTRQDNDASEPTPSGVADTLVLSSLASGSYDVVFSGGFTNVPTEPDATATYTAGGTFALTTTNAIAFNSDGLPSAFAVADIEIIDFANGAANMDDNPSAGSKIALDLGTVAGADGFTQFGAAFTPVFINQNGSRFGTFAGVTIGNDGLVTALFDNGETRPIFQIPIATFTNVNQLESRSGNTWNATQASGDVTLRVADNGSAGQVVQGALEASTVDIGEEFTKMIVVQRAFSAAAQIITTADDMLSELLRVKR